VAETIIGRWLKQRAIPRERVVIATKVRGSMGDAPNDEGLSRAHIMNAVEASLGRLDTDYIDLYQSHWFDEHTPIEETLRAYDDLIRQGKVRYLGASNYPAWRLMQALWVSDKFGLARYDCVQPHYNLVHREEFEHELADVCHTYGLGVIPYSPLAGGFLTGKYHKDQPLPESARAGHVSSRYSEEHSWSLLEKVTEIARKRGKTPSQVALSWLLCNPIVTSPIIGPRTLEQFLDNLGALEVSFSDEDQAALV
jgi:aryl-alcohol dehydrogenase-like predicted oxidoreductase